jgi:hypothetical protein
MSIFSEWGNREKVPIFRTPIFLAKLSASSKKRRKGNTNNYGDVSGLEL